MPTLGNPVTLNGPWGKPWAKSCGLVLGSTHNDPNNPRSEPSAEKTHSIESNPSKTAAERTEGLM